MLRAMTTTSAEGSRIARAKAAYTTRHVPGEELSGLKSATPSAGDLVLARVAEIGQHKRLESPEGRRTTLFPGDEVLVCYADRYAPDQFEAVVPADLGPCDLVAAGGVAARMVSQHAEMSAPTRLDPVGLVTTAGGRVANLQRWRLREDLLTDHRPWTIAVIGTSMNAGKTTTAAGIARGLIAEGHTVGAAKVTGTGAGGDAWLLRDAGAEPVLDFTSVGLASTYRCDEDVVLDSFHTLHSHLAASGADVAVIEVADGVFQRETAALIASSAFHETVDTVVFAAGDAMGALAGVEHLRLLGLPVVAASGLLTCSPLATAEAAEHLSVPVLSLDELWSAHQAIRPVARPVDELLLTGA